MDLSSVDWVAVSVTIALALGFAAGTSRGLVPAILDLLAMVFALHMACRHYEYIARLLRFALNASFRHSNVLGFIAVFIAMYVVAEVVASLLARLIGDVDASAADRLLGGIAGLARAYVVVALFMWLVLHAPFGVLAAHISRSGASMAIVRSVPVLFESVGASLPTVLDPE